MKGAEKTLKKISGKRKYILMKSIIFIMIAAGFSVYAFNFPATMNLIDKSLSRVCKTAGLDVAVTIFSDYSKFVGKAVDCINYAAEIISDNIKACKEEKIFSGVITSCAAKFPSENMNITSGFGMRNDPITGIADSHSGIDIAAAEGSVIVSAWPGKVAETGFDKIYGNFVLVEHSKGFFTKYCHLSKITVTENEFVLADRKIGEAGNTGRTTGSHLHFEVIINGIEIDPMECFAV